MAADITLTLDAPLHITHTTPSDITHTHLSYHQLDTIHTPAITPESIAHITATSDNTHIPPTAQCAPVHARKPPLDPPCLGGNSTHSQCPFCHLESCIIVRHLSWLVGSSPLSLMCMEKRYKVY